MNPGILNSDKVEKRIDMARRGIVYGKSYRRILKKERREQARKSAINEFDVETPVDLSTQ